MSTHKTTVADIVRTGLTAAASMAGASAAGAEGALDASRVAELEPKRVRLAPPPTSPGYEPDMLDD
jgi:hypothetical protein